MILLIKKKANNVDSQSVNKELHYNTTHTDYLYQRKVIKTHKTFILHQQYFTFQRQYNTNNLELMIQTMQSQIEQMQAQIDNLTSNNPPP